MMDLKGMLKEWARSLVLLRVTLAVVVFAFLLGLLVDNRLPFNRYFNSAFGDAYPDRRVVEQAVLGFLDGYTGGKLRVADVAVSMGEVRPVLIYREVGGVSTPGVLFVVGGEYVLAGRMFDVDSRKDVALDIFGRRPVLFDMDRINLDGVHWQGSASPKVTIVEYGAYSCPRCQAMEKVMVPFVDNHPEVRRIYKHMPLSPGDQYLAEVAEAAAEQGEKYFWALHEVFMSTDNTGRDEAATKRWVKRVAVGMGIDWEKLKRSLASGRARRRVSRDKAEFAIEATPTLVIDGEGYVGGMSYGELAKIVSNRLNG